MLKSIALWLCPTLVDPDFIDSANQQLSHQRQIIADYEANNALVLAEIQAYSDELAGTKAELEFSKKTIAENKETLAKTNDACNAEIDRVMILSGRLNQIDNALKKRVVAHNSKHTMRTVVDRQNAILDEIAKIVVP